MPGPPSSTTRRTRPSAAVHATRRSGVPSGGVGEHVADERVDRGLQVVRGGLSHEQRAVWLSVLDRPAAALVLGQRRPELPPRSSATTSHTSSGHFTGASRGALPGLADDARSTLALQLLDVFGGAAPARRRGTPRRRGAARSAACGGGGTGRPRAPRRRSRSRWIRSASRLKASTDVLHLGRPGRRGPSTSKSPVAHQSAVWRRPPAR